MADTELDADFEGGEAGASVTYPQQCSALRKNGYVMIKSNYLIVFLCEIFVFLFTKSIALLRK